MEDNQPARDAQGHFVSQSDSDNNPDNNTMPYGADQVQPKAKVKQESAREFAERGIVEKHGEAIRQNPQFDELVKREMAQVAENQRNTEGM
jgi:hypothetical protein